VRSHAASSSGRHSGPSAPGRCAHCEGRESPGTVVLPFEAKTRNACMASRRMLARMARCAGGRGHYRDVGKSSTWEVFRSPSNPGVKSSRRNPAGRWYIRSRRHARGRRSGLLTEGALCASIAARHWAVSSAFSLARGSNTSQSGSR
jgi:hypothetical protein